MSSVPHLPLRGDCGAPSFDPTSPCDLQQYFADLEYLFEQSHIKDTAQKKSSCAYFVDFATRELWQSLPQFSDLLSDFSNFRSVIFHLYPEYDDAHRYLVADLESLVEERSCHTIESLAEYGEYYRP